MIGHHFVQNKGRFMMPVFVTQYKAIVVFYVHGRVLAQYLVCMTFSLFFFTNTANWSKSMDIEASMVVSKTLSHFKPKYLIKKNGCLAAGNWSQHDSLCSIGSKLDVSNNLR